MVETVVVRGARLYDGRGLGVVDNAVVVCEGGRIMYAGSATDATSRPM